MCDCGDGGREVTAREDAGEGWFQIVLAKESQADIFDVGDGFEDGAEREAKGRGHVVVGREIRWESRFVRWVHTVSTGINKRKVTT